MVKIISSASVVKNMLVAVRKSTIYSNGYDDFDENCFNFMKFTFSSDSTDKTVERSLLSGGESEVRDDWQVIGNTG